MPFIKLTELTRGKANSALNSAEVRVDKAIIINAESIAHIAEVDMVPEEIPIVGQSQTVRVSMIFFRHGHKAVVTETVDDIWEMVRNLEGTKE